MHYRKLFTACFSIIFSIPAHAMFCPNNFNQIDIGNTIAQVQAQCGAPSSEDKSQASGNVPQEWVYFSKTAPSDTTSLRMTIYFNKGVVSNITVNGVGVASTQICGGNAASVGANMNAIKQACGSPAYVKQSNNPGDSANEPQIVKWTYQGTPSVILTFENGVLKSRQ